jgi:hypothetical protein
MASRQAFVFSGTLNDVDAKDNTILDTGATLNGSGAILSNITTGARNRIRTTTISTKSGTAMSVTIPDETKLNTMNKKSTQNLASIAAHGSTTFNITVPGARIQDKVTAVPLQGIEAGLSFVAAVSATDTVTIRVNNGTDAAIDPANRIWRAWVERSDIDL